MKQLAAVLALALVTSAPIGASPAKQDANAASH